TVGGVGVADGEFAGVVFGLCHALGQLFIPRLGLVHRQLGVAIFQNVIGGERLAAFAVAFDATGGNGIFAADAAAFDDAPTCRFQRGINMLGACLGFVHAGNGFFS